MEECVQWIANMLGGLERCGCSSDGPTYTFAFPAALPHLQATNGTCTGVGSWMRLVYTLYNEGAQLTPWTKARLVHPSDSKLPSS